MEVSNHSKRKKRTADEVQTSSGGERGVLTTFHDSSTTRSSFQTLFLEQQMNRLQAELDHERSMRQLDKKRTNQTIERLEKQVELSETQAREATEQLEDYRYTTTDARINELRGQHDQTLQTLRKYEIQLLQKEEDDDEEVKEMESAAVRLYKEKCEHLQTLLDQQKENEDELRKNITHLKSQFENMKAPDVSASSASSEETKRLLEEAPPALLTELHRIRMDLSESQRNERQLKRKCADFEQRNHNLIREREEFRLASQRIPVVQEQLDQVQAEYAKIEAQHSAWKEFGRLLCQLLKLPSAIHQGPPELSAIEHVLAKTSPKASALATPSQVQQEHLQKLKQNLELKNEKIRHLESSVAELSTSKNALERELGRSRSEVERARSQQEVLKREIDSLRNLIETFDNLPLASAAESRAGDILKSPKLDTSKRTLQISLDAAKEEARLAQTDSERLKNELDLKSSELDRVKEKFEKLKEALQAERAKAAESAQRANEAEALAGKGSFDPSKTRVLHFTETPLVEALKEEIQVLKRQLEAAKGSKAMSKSALHNPDKLNQRLKENFKEQIATFREGVYLATGFKIDMLPNTDRPTFRVRSLYSASENDHLLLKWPKCADVASLDILNTDFAKALSQTPSYQYMTKFHSLPAFLASVQMALFENTTQMA